MEDKYLNNKESSTHYEEVSGKNNWWNTFRSHIVEVWVTQEFYKRSQWTKSCILSGFESIFGHLRDINCIQNRHAAQAQLRGHLALEQQPVAPPVSL